MRTLKTSEAASLLNVSPNTLRAWERRFGYPKPQRSAGKHRLYTHGDIASLRDALHEGLSISSAISVAREALSSETHSLLGALTSFELDRADAAMEAALALRSLERTVVEVLLPSLEELADRHGLDSAPWAHAAQWANSWLRRAQRLAPPPTRPISVIVGDATRDELDADSPALRALELLCARAGAHVLTLPVRSLAGLGELLSTRSSDVVVIAGSSGSDDEIARWAYAVRSACGPQPVALYRRTREGERPRASGTARILPDSPLEAQHALIEIIFTAEPIVPESAPLHRRRPVPSVRPVRRRALA